MTRAEYVAELRTWLRTPFHHGQALKGVGCDCIGVLVGAARDLGHQDAVRWLADKRFIGYGPTPRVDLLRQACNEYMIPIPLHSATLGDVILFTFMKGKRATAEPMHFGVISRTVPQLYVIHGYQRVGEVTENAVAATFWQPLAAFQLKGIV